jgi:diguanylate cyclase (GGDEF)-like protein
MASLFSFLFTDNQTRKEPHRRFVTHAFFSRYIQQLVGFLAILVLAAIWAFTYSRAVHEKQAAFDARIVQNKNISVIVALNLEQVLNKATLYANVSRSYIEGNAPNAFALNPLLIGDPSYLRFAIFSGTGSLLYSSAARSREPELAPLVTQALDAHAAAHPVMLVGLPGKDSAAWRLPLLIPIQAKSGAHIGFFAAIVDLGYFLQLYKPVSLGKDGSIGIFKRNGMQIAELHGTSLSSGPGASRNVYEKFQNTQTRSGVIGMQASNRGSDDIGVFQHLDTYPLVITVTHVRHSLLNSIHEKQQDYILQAAIASLTVGMMLWGLYLLITRQQELLNELTHSEGEKKALIHELEQEKIRAYELASHDFLTGIPNRMLFHELAQAELSRAKRSRNLYALLFMDLNRFKPINDTLGHDIGDMLLKAVAQRLRKAVRAYDIVARIGGDEFVILLSELQSKEQVAEIAGKIIQSISFPFDDLDGHSVEISTSVGIALYPRDGQNVNTLLRHADAAMYCAKNDGVGKYCFYDTSLNESSVRHFELLSRFRLALKDNEFCLHYQPKIGLQKFELTGLEALVRWNHPEHGLIYPGDFIELLEKHELIDALGEWIVNEACRQLAAWRCAGIPVSPVAVNISAKQLRDRSLCNVIQAALNRHQLPADLLEIEITESCLIDDFDKAKELLESLRDLGINISIDDYGTGFSGLSSLKKLPIYAIKIDKSFVRDLRNDVSDAVIVASTITLAHNLGLIVVAEGVESREQAVHLKTAGYDQVQGFYFQRPAAAADIPALLTQRVFYPEYAS